MKVVAGLLALAAGSALIFLCSLAVMAFIRFCQRWGDEWWSEPLCLALAVPAIFLCGGAVTGLIVLAVAKFVGAA
jgi:hypothetical protein